MSCSFLISLSLFQKITRVKKIDEEEDEDAEITEEELSSLSQGLHQHTDC